jgi:transcriptional regulator with XRE-family HTH domain
MANPAAVPPDVLEQLGSNLRGMREQAGLTVDQLAAACGETAETIAEIENGTREARLREWIAIHTGMEIASGKSVVPAAERPTTVDYAWRFGVVSRHYRDLRGMSAYDLARRTAEDPDYILSLEAGEQEPGMTQWIKVVDVLEIPEQGAFAWVQGFGLPPDLEQWPEDSPSEETDGLQDDPEDDDPDGASLN